MSELTELERLADDWFRAYNDYDINAMRNLLAPNVHQKHFGRGSETFDRDSAIDKIVLFKSLMPTRGFSDRLFIQQINDTTVVVRHTWSGTPTDDIPGFAKAGETFAMELAGFVTFEGGQMVGYADYG